ncbi:MAG: PilZ domain-containing protein [Desulfatiglandales bacterium]
MKEAMVSKVYLIGQDLFVCPVCGIKKRLDREKLIRYGPKIKIRCTCGNRYSIELRRSYRKRVDLACYIGVHARQLEGRGIIKDLSTTGVGFTLLDPLDLLCGDMVTISFQLDSPSKPHIVADVRVKRIHNQIVGCEVISWRNHEREVWYYLLPVS